MTQDSGPQDPDQQGELPPGYPPSYPPPPPPPPGYGYAPPGYVADPPGFYMGRPLANWAQRVGAWLTDGVPFWIFWFLLTVVELAAPDSQAGTALVQPLLLVALVVGAYNRWVLQGQTGQSWGKRLLKLRLVRMSDGLPPGAVMAFVRDLAHVVDAAICFIGFLVPLFDARRQTFADKMVSTLVLDETGAGAP